MAPRIVVAMVTPLLKLDAGVCQRLDDRPVPNRTGAGANRLLSFVNVAQGPTAGGGNVRRLFATRTGRTTNTVPTRMSGRFVTSGLGIDDYRRKTRRDVRS